MSAIRVPRLGRLVLGAALFLASLWGPATVSASCVVVGDGTEPWADADAVFVGTVTDLANNGRTANVRVEEVWSGPDLQANVVVLGGPEGDMMTSIDRTYEVGVRYLFGVTIIDSELHDSACSGTTPTDLIDLEALRPELVRGPEGLSGDVQFPAGPAVVVAIVVGLLLATVLLVGRREA